MMMEERLAGPFVPPLGPGLTGVERLGSTRTSAVSLLEVTSCGSRSEAGGNGELRKMSYSEIMDKKITSL